MRIAGVQAASADLDRKATIGKVLTAMEEADVRRLKVNRARRQSAEFE